MSPMAHATQEVFLHQAEFFAGHCGVGGIEHAGDVFAADLLFHGFEVIAAVEDVDVEIFGGARGEQAQPIHGLAEVADDRHVGRNPEDDLVVDPGLLQIAVGVALGVDAAVHWDADRLFRMLDLEWRAIGFPAVGLLALEAVDDLLLEQADIRNRCRSRSRACQAWQAIRGSMRRDVPGRRFPGRHQTRSREPRRDRCRTRRTPRDTTPRCEGSRGCRPTSGP